MTTEYVWNELRVRRDDEGKWRYFVGRLGTWVRISTDPVVGVMNAAVIAELDKKFPPTRTVTLDWYTFTLRSDEEGQWWHNDEWGTYGDDPLGKALDRIWELENEDDR